MDKYLTPEQVTEMVPGLSKGQLAQMRFTGKGGLRYFKPTPRKILYKESDVIQWIEDSARTGTASDSV